MTGPLAPQRGTRAWNKLRHTWQERINAAGGWPCRRTGQTIPPHQPKAWDLGHPHDTTTGPTRLNDLAPELAHHNRSAGATTGNHNRTRQTLPPSRTWTP